VRATRETLCRPRAVSAPSRSLDASRRAPRDAAADRRRPARRRRGRGPGTGGGHPGGRDRRRLTRGPVQQLVGVGAEQGHDQIEAVQQRGREAPRVPGPVGGRARQAPSKTPSPQGHGFIAAARRNWAGKVTVPPARLTRITPSSSGWRSASSAPRGTRPSRRGRARRGWPMKSRRAAATSCPRRRGPRSRRCGAGPGKGGWLTSTPSGSGTPAAECTLVTTSDSSGVSAGSRPGRRSASMVLPEPGGPTISRWCRPAAATSRAWRPKGCPRTSARSGMSGGGGGAAPAGWPATRPGSAGSAPGRPATTPRGRPSPRTKEASRASHSGTTSRAVPWRRPGRSCPGHGAASRSGRARRRRRALRCSPVGVGAVATSTPTAMARSSPAPPFRTPDGPGSP
jgi:hypothetical protein